jgi:cobalt-zinc-cadmium efflux system protein
MTEDVSRQRERRLRVALALNVLIVAFQVVLGIIAGSLGLLADAGHNLADVAAIVVSVIAVRLARRQPTASRSFGYHRGTILAAQANAASILAVCVIVTAEAIRRLFDPHPVEGGLVVVAAIIATAANVLAAMAIGNGEPTRPAETDAGAADESEAVPGHTHASGGHAHDHQDALRPPASAGHGHGHDLNMRSAWLHTMGDAAASLAVAIAGTIILVTDGAYWLDPAASLVVSALIGVQGWRLLRSTADVLLESTPSGLDLAALADTMVAVEGVEAVHDLHVWTLSSDVRALSAHVVLEGHPTLEEAQVVGERVKGTIGGPFLIAHATLELECEACGEPADWCAIDTNPLDARANPT